MILYDEHRSGPTHIGNDCVADLARAHTTFGERLQYVKECAPAKHRFAFEIHHRFPWTCELQRLPNDGEVVYHTPEGWDNAALKILVNSAKLTSDSLATLLLRKTDWHDYDSVYTERYLGTKQNLSEAPNDRLGLVLNSLSGHQHR